MNFNARYNKIHKHVILLALFPQSAYKFKFLCRLLSQGIMKASQHPVDSALTDRDWFKAGVKMLIKPMVDEGSAESPDDLNISDGAYKVTCDGFKTFVKSVRWYLKKLSDSDERDLSVGGFPAFCLEEEFASAHALLKWIVYQIDGGRLYYGSQPEDEIFTHREDSLLFNFDEKIGVREFRPWALEELDKECRKGENLGKKLIPKEMWEKREEIQNDYDRFMEDEEAGDRELDALLDFYDPLIPDLPSDGMPMPPPPPRAEEKKPVEKSEEKKPAEKKSAETKPKIRFTVEEKDGFTSYTDGILGVTYRISNGCGAKKRIDKLIEDLTLDRLEQLYTEWSKVKGLFLRDDAAKFNNHQIYHEPKEGSDEKHPSKQFTGRWRIRSDAEIKVRKKELKKLKSL